MRFFVVGFYFSLYFHVSICTLFLFFPSSLQYQRYVLVMSTLILFLRGSVASLRSFSPPIRWRIKQRLCFVCPCVSDIFSCVAIFFFGSSARFILPPPLAILGLKIPGGRRCLTTNPQTMAITTTSALPLCGTLKTLVRTIGGCTLEAVTWYPHRCLWKWPYQKKKMKIGAVIHIRENTHKMRKSVSKVVRSKMQLTLHATRLTPYGASRLVSAMSVPCRRQPDVLRPGIVRMRGSMAIRLPPCMK